MAKPGPKVRPITVAQILGWADAWHAEVGQWPGMRSGPVPGAGLSWYAVDTALRVGARSLPGGDTLYRLLRRERGLAERRGRRPDAARHAEIVRLRADGLTQAEIGQRLGVTYQAVGETLRRIAAAEG
jgi:hypothetical protein